MEDKLQNEMQQQMEDQSLLSCACDFAKDYLAFSKERHVFPFEEDIENLAVFEEVMPVESGQPHEILNKLNNYGGPATLPMTGGRYFGFVNGAVVPIGMAARWLGDAWDQNTALQIISPICSKLEEVTQKWLIDIFDLPEHTVAGFVSGTSMATFCGLAAARFHIYKKLGWDWHHKGMFDAPKLNVIASIQSHSTAVKALGLLGFGKDNIKWIDVDDEGRIKVKKIPHLDEKTIVVLQAGNVDSGSFDDFESIGKMAEKAGAWIHIDGAFGLWAEAVTELKHLTNGMQLADSWSVDGHKTLNTPYDNGIVLCKHANALSSALHMSGSYIVNSSERDGMYYTPEMSRRGRIIELWAIMKYLGKNGIDEMILTMHKRSLQFRDALSEAGFNILNDVVFNQVLVACENDVLTLSTLKEIQEDRVCWCGPSEWFGKKVIRISVCSWVTTKEDVEKTVASFVRSREKALNIV